MKKFILAVVLAVFGTAAYATESSYVFVVPQKPGSGTSVWAQIVATELEKYLDTNIVIKHIPGARDIPGFNKFHNELQHKDNVIMVSHGGNGVAFLQENVDYNYADYESIGLMNLNIIMGIHTDADENNPKFSAGSGMVPEAFAMALMICGPDKTLAEYTRCFQRHVTWVRGMNTGERRLAWKRGELTATRENPAAFKKHVIPSVVAGTARVWMHHGILNATQGTHSDDPNYPGLQLEILFEEKWGVAPSGPFYDAYKLVKSFRDGLQKALWVRKGNPNLGQLREALLLMSVDEESMANIRKKVGDYQWLIGEQGNSQRDTLMTFVTAPALRTLISFNRNALGLDSVYKSHIVPE